MRKDLTYACREEKQCTIDKRQRNRCQYCRYQKCLMCGMKREAVQEERQRGGGKLTPKKEPGSGGGGGIGTGGGVGGVGSVGGVIGTGGNGPAADDSMNPTSSVRELTIDRILEAEEMSESRTGDNAIPYLRVGPNSMVPPEYKVCVVRTWYRYQCACIIWSIVFVSILHREPFHICAKW